MQNISNAVMATRIEPADSRDDFPTPPWATRALIEHVLDKAALTTMSCLEPACGRGHMAKALKEYFRDVTASDAYHYGHGPVRDFLTDPYGTDAYDWVITNPPFRLAEDFVLKSLRVARRGVAILARTVFLESCGRYQTIFSFTPPSKFAQFVERVPMLRGRLARIIHHLLIFCGGYSAKWPIHIANRCLFELLRATAERHNRHDRRYSASL